MEIASILKSITATIIIIGEQDSMMVADTMANVIEVINTDSSSM